MRVVNFAAASVARAPVRVAVVAVLGVLTANCSFQVADSKVDPKYGVAPSERVVAEGAPVPRVRGRAMVGRPYTIAGRRYVPRVDEDYSREGLASWYGPGFHGRRTANGEVFDKHSVTAAHTTMPLPSYARVTNLVNNRSMIVRVNDRGPFHGNRVIDVSQSVAEALDFRHRGVQRVRVDYVGPASTKGSDDRILISTLRSDGMLAQLPDGGTTPSTMVASAQPPASARSPVAPRTAPAAPVVASAAPPAAYAGARGSSRGPMALNALAPAPGAAGQPAGARGGVAFAGLFFAEPDLASPGFVRDGAFAGVSTYQQGSLRRER
ncbi:MAG: septal ring lytic transglycosylase RlpA family protein [Salinarimonadaceae bacterium]|nr:MAG: septal ring lytic transglycosylase RlpA family protein [Salinarimonadaceae bacterium]